MTVFAHGEHGRRDVVTRDSRLASGRASALSEPRARHRTTTLRRHPRPPAPTTPGRCRPAPPQRHLSRRSPRQARVHRTGTGRLQEPGQGPYGTLWHEMDHPHGRGDAQAASPLSERRSPRVLALPHRSGPAAAAPSRPVASRREVATPNQNQPLRLPRRVELHDPAEGLRRSLSVYSLTGPKSETCANASNLGP